jgi:predicted RNA-binding Zn ribbon-like protein
MVNQPPMCDDLPTRKFQFVGGDLSLDFCNTVGGKRSAVARECLNTFADLVGWSEQAGLIGPAEAAELRRKAQTDPGAGEAVLARAVQLREAIFRIFLALAEDKSPAECDLTELNAELARGMNRLRVGRADAGFAWQWAPAEGQLDVALAPVARAAAELLISGHKPGHVNQCEGDNCGWLFIDASKNHSRRWCDMRECGNRAKVRRHRLRQQRRKDS